MESLAFVGWIIENWINLGITEDFLSIHKELWLKGHPISAFVRQVIENDERVLHIFFCAFPLVNWCILMYLDTQEDVQSGCGMEM